MKNIYLGTQQIHSNDSNIGFLVAPNIKGLEQPSIRLPSFDRPNTDGSIVPNQLYGGRLITLSGKVFASTVVDYRTRRRLLETAVNIQRTIDGILQPITMKFTTMDDLALQVDVYTRKFDFPDGLLMSGDYKVDFVAPSIYLLGQTLKTQLVSAFTGGGMAIPTGIPTAMNVGGISAETLTNSGNIPAYPIITLEGPLEDPTLTNETADQTMNITYTLNAGESIEIDTINRTAVYYASLGASPVNVRQYISGDFITVEPGENIIKLTLAAYNDDGAALFAWRDSYSGI